MGRDSSYEHYQAEDPLTERIIEQILNRVSTRRYPRSLEGNNFRLKVRGVSRNSISRCFILGIWKKIVEWMNRPLDQLDLVAYSSMGSNWVSSTPWPVQLALIEKAKSTRWRRHRDPPKCATKHRLNPPRILADEINHRLTQIFHKIR